MRPTFKYYLCSLIVALFCFYLPLNANDGFKYQTVIRKNGQIVSGQQVILQASIRSGSAVGQVIYDESFTQTTDPNGLVSVVIGNGTTTDDFSIIPWQAGPYFIEIAFDLQDGSGSHSLGTRQLLSVPYAIKTFVSDTDNVDDDDAYTGNEFNTSLSFTNYVLTLEDAGGQLSIDLSSLEQSDDDEDPTNELNVALDFTNNILSIEDAGSVHSTDLTILMDGVNDDDTTGTNEIQWLERAGDTIKLMPDGGYILDSTVIYTAGSGISILGSTISTDICDLEIGDLHEGGIIIYIDQSGCHGIVCAQEDQAQNVQWYSGSTPNTTGGAMGYYTGALNTFLAAYYLDPGNYAPQICDGLTLEGYDDWYLPSRDEISLLYNLHTLGVGNLSGSYWSSTTLAHNWDVALSVDMSTGTISYPNKTELLNVRAFRIF